ncbi:MAG: DUF2442 domain-containing protein [Bacteroidales bacterium]|nr:DUF2442 domain-containing protein [Bacteroidales bacterium]
MNSFLEITKAEYDGDYRLRLWFNNGQVRVADLEHSLNGEAFQPLRDKQYFQRFKIPFNTVEWDNGADFAPEYLYEHSVRPYDTDNETTIQTAAEPHEM